MAFVLKWLEFNNLTELTYEFIGRDWFLERLLGFAGALSQVVTTIQGIWSL